MKIFRHLLLLAITGSLLILSPAFASEDAPASTTSSDDDIVGEPSIDFSPTYNLYADVDMVSTLKFQYGRPGIVIKLVYPQLASDTENDGVNNFNQIVLQLVQDEADKFRNDVKERQPYFKNLAKGVKIRNDLYVDYDTSFLTSQENHIVSVRFSIQGYIAGLSHPYHYHRVLNFNVDTGQEIQLSDLFKPDSAYLAVLSAYTSNVLTKQLRNREMIAEGTAPKAENFSNWNIKPNGLLITFDEYKVAPYINGAQTILVPYSALQDVLAPDSVISGCVAHRRRCSSHNLLTGGFIDEAAASVRKPPAALSPQNKIA